MVFSPSHITLGFLSQGSLKCPTSSLLIGWLIRDNPSISTPVAFSVCPDGVPCNERCHAMPATMYSLISSGLCPIFLETCLRLLSPLPSVYLQVGCPSTEILGSGRVLDLGIFRLEHLSGSDPWGWHWGKDEFSCVIEHSFMSHVNLIHIVWRKFFSLFETVWWLGILCLWQSSQHSKSFRFWGTSDFRFFFNLKLPNLYIIR